MFSWINIRMNIMLSWTNKKQNPYEPAHDKTNKIEVCQAKSRLRSAWASAQSDQSLLCTQWVAKDPSFLYADSEDFDQTEQMPRLI